MGCNLQDNSDGRCTIAEDGIEVEGQEDGICVCSTDEDPGVVCSGYEPDWVCDSCGVDLNVVDCECGE